MMKNLLVTKLMLGGVILTLFGVGGCGDILTTPEPMTNGNVVNVETGDGSTVDGEGIDIEINECPDANKDDENVCYSPSGTRIDCETGLRLDPPTEEGEG